MQKLNINNEDLNLCDTCEHVVFQTKHGQDGKEVRCYKCNCSECHSYKIKECPNYSNPNAFQRFLRNKLAVTFLSLIVIGLIVATIVIFT